MLRILPLLFLLSACATAPKADQRIPSSGETVRWNTHGGIDYANVANQLIVIRADLTRTPLELFNPPATSRSSMGQFAREQQLAVLINAAMFATDYVTSVGYMRNYDQVNNPRFNARMQGFLMFNPKDAGSPAAKVGRRSEIDAYHTVFQTYRMWDAQEGILWKKGASYYHQVGLVGVDGENRVLFFYHPAFVDVHDLVERIIGLGLNLRGLLYLDGGNHASLYLDSAIGRSWNTGLSLPNLLGLRAQP